MWGYFAYLLILVASLIQFSSGLLCFGCSELKSCQKFWNSTLEEKKTSFTLKCGENAAGCMRGYKYKDGSNNTVLELEVLQCYDGNGHHRNFIQMNNCTQVSETERFYCACDSGDYCIGGKENGNGGGYRMSSGIWWALLFTCQWML